MGDREPADYGSFEARMAGCSSCLGVLVLMMIPSVVAVAIGLLIWTGNRLYELEEFITSNVFGM